MRPVAVFLLLALSGLGAENTPIMRAVSVKAIPTTVRSLPEMDFATIAAAWKDRGVELNVEGRLNVASIAKAGEVIREMFQRSGHAVRVEHTIEHRGRGVEVAFQVIQLCQCD